MKVTHGWQAAINMTLVALGLAIPPFAPPSALALEDDVEATVKRRVRDWQPTRDERSLDQIGWASDLAKAQQAAQKHRRPLFVFTYNGSATRANALALQRC
jgi:adenylate kinase